MASGHITQSSAYQEGRMMCLGEAELSNSHEMVSSGLGDMVQSVKYLICKHKGLSCIPRTHILHGRASKIFLWVSRLTT